MTRPRIHPLGDTAIVCETAPPATLDCQRRFWALAERARLMPHVVEVVPGMNNLTIVFDPLAADYETLAGQLESGWDAAESADMDSAGIEIPVRYGGEEGPDLAALAKHT